MHTASLKRVFGKLLWKLFLSPRGLSKSQFHDGISSVTLPSKTKITSSTEWNVLGFCVTLSFSNGVEWKVILEAKSSSWRQFCTSLTSTTSLSKVWKEIKSFSGNRPPCFIPTLLAQGISAKNKQHKSNVLANQFALSSSSANYPPRIYTIHMTIALKSIQMDQKPLLEPAAAYT